MGTKAMRGMIAGIAIAGDNGVPHRRGITMMQNSGLGNAVSPLTSLTWTFSIAQLLIGDLARLNLGSLMSRSHALMGPITPDHVGTMQIPWELFPTETKDIGPALEPRDRAMDRSGRPYAL